MNNTAFLPPVLFFSKGCAAGAILNATVTPTLLAVLFWALVVVDLGQTFTVACLVSTCFCVSLASAALAGTRKAVVFWGRFCFFVLLSAFTTPFIVFAIGWTALVVFW